MINENMSNEEYNKIDALRSTTIKNMLRGPEYYKMKADGPFERTDALIFGTQVHERILEPEVYQGKYQEKLDWRSAEGRQQKKLVLDGKLDVITPKDANRVEQIHDAFFTDARCKKIFEESKPEVVGVQKDFYFGKDCKVKADLLGPGYIADLKTTTDIPLSDGAAMWLIKKYNYHLSAALYLDLFRALGMLELANFTWIFVESDQPHKIVIVDSAINSDLLREGRKKYQKAISKISYHEAMSSWKEQMSFTID